MAELLQNREQNIEHAGIYIADHRKQFPCIAGALEHPIAGVQHRSVWLGLMLRRQLSPMQMKCTCNANDSTYITLPFLFKVKYFMGHIKGICTFFFKYLLDY